MTDTPERAAVRTMLERSAHAEGVSPRPDDYDGEKLKAAYDRAVDEHVARGLRVTAKVGRATSAYLNTPCRSLHQYADELDLQISMKRQQRERTQQILRHLDDDIAALEARRDAVGDELCR